MIKRKKKFNLRLTSLLLLLGMAWVQIYAQIPVVKVDFNIEGRSLAEVNEPEYISWIKSDPRSRTFDGVTFEIKNGGYTDGWYKVGVQAPYYARLAADGFKTESIELHIIGLQVGKHSLVSFHNALDNPDGNVFSPLDVYVNDVLIHDNLELSEKVLSNAAAATSYVEFDVVNDDTVVIRFESDPLPNSTISEIYISGFHLNTSDPKRMANFEYPADKDEHVNTDGDSLVFYWTPPENTVSHNIYLGTDQTELYLANTNSPQFLKNTADTFFIEKNFYSLDSYYWRVDPIDTNGDTTKGDVWYFKKRIQSFPGAEGYGAYAIGGRGGKIVYVNNLDDSGPGSFRDAIENQSGPRTVLFNVSGLITLNSRLVISDDYVTIAGQSAPGKGICFRWAPIGVTGDNLIVQNIRMRLGIGITFDGMGLTGAQNSIIDHCSVSWTIDEAFSSRSAKNITLQRTLISEALNEADHANYGSTARHGYAASIGGDIGSFHHNLLAHCAGRNWSLAGGLDGDGYYSGRLDITNNVVYNWGHRATDGGAHEVNFAGNYYKMGAATSQTTILKAELEGLGLGSQSYYFNGNIVENTNGTLACDGTDNSCSRTYELSNGQVVDWDVWVDEPFFPSEATVHSGKDAFKHVLSDVGCTQPAFDDHDIRIIDETLNGTTSLSGSRTGIPGLPDHEQDAGGWEAYPGFFRSPNWDTDLDGLPNWWEKAYGLDTNSVSGDYSESNADADKNGYTNLEEYLHWMSIPHYFIHNEDSLTINLEKYTKGFSDSPVYELTDVIDGDAEIKTDTSILIFKPTQDGFAELEFKVSDAEGSSFVQKIGIFNGKIESDSMFTYTYFISRTGNSYITVDSVNTLTVVPDDTTSIVAHRSNVLDVVVFPNPANNQLNVDFESTIRTESEFYIFDIVGQIVLQKNYPVKQGSNSTSVDISALSPGLYTLKIKNNEKYKAVRFIKN